MSGGMIKNFRVMILLYVLLVVAISAWLTKVRSTDWNEPLVVVVYPINGDGSEVVRKYINELDVDKFSDIEDFFSREAKDYKLITKKPVKIKLSKEIDTIPPKPPHSSSRRQASVLSIMFWSLKLRYWSWRMDNYDYPKDIQMFVIYFDPEKNNRLAHSLGLQKGLIGVVNAFATKRMTKENNVIIAHEIFHTVGASDKYDPKTNFPLFPVGFAEPDKEPSVPQSKAEIMAGRIPITTKKADTPKSLKNVVVGEITAREINWLATE